MRAIFLEPMTYRRVFSASPTVIFGVTSLAIMLLSPPFYYVILERGGEERKREGEREGRREGREGKGRKEGKEQLRG